MRVEKEKIKWAKKKINLTRALKFSIIVRQTLVRALWEKGEIAGQQFFFLKGFTVQLRDLEITNIPQRRGEKYIEIKELFSASLRLIKRIFNYRDMRMP